VRAFRLACLAYFVLALPGSTLGVLWPSIRLSLHQPVAALGVLLIVGVAASVVASAATGPLLARVSTGSVLALGTLLTALALAAEILTGSVWVFAAGMVVFGLGFGPLDAALNAYAAHRFGARQINWMHASYGLGATVGPALTTAMLSNGLGWRWVYGAMGLIQALLAVVLAAGRRSWLAPPPRRPEANAEPVERRPAPVAVLLGSLAFTAVETGIESAAGVWGYLFLTDGRGLGRAAAGLAVSAYWAMMFVGRVVLGPLAERVGPQRVLGMAVAGVSAGAALMAVPGPAPVAVAGLMLLGLAAAPIFPLFTLTTAQRMDIQGTTHAVGLQVAASTVGSAALPAGIGLVVASLGAAAMAPPLLLLGLTMGALHYGLSTLPILAGGAASRRRSRS
jgi:fucose permease